MKRDSLVDYKAIGLRLATLRRIHGLQASQAAAKAGVTARSWRKWERGSPFTTPSFLKICRAFDCSADWLVLGVAQRGHTDQEEKLVTAIRGHIALTKR